MTELALCESDMRVVEYLREHGPSTNKELASALYTGSAAKSASNRISVIILRLHEKGIVGFVDTLKAKPRGRQFDRLNQLRDHGLTLVRKAPSSDPSSDDYHGQPIGLDGARALRERCAQIILTSKLSDPIWTKP